MVEYETLYLRVTKEEAARRISERVEHVACADEGGVIDYRTNVGVHLATLSDVTLESGEPGTKLRYRTSVIRPHLFHARNEARQIRDAVERYRTSERER
ncbi:hypothetical protein [Halomarina pelagica]|uniref:hypothetical protein n=1 Tax=Halomarina pelagica TaxID=2961599 RepID=UPI0020C3685C|nr:hypothetical protein [Halomarina sp. BND7]